jgi:hypothetical protein
MPTDQEKYKNYINNLKPTNDSTNENVLETINEERKEYILLIIWLIITIFVFSITVITIISGKEINPYIKYITTGIVLFSFFFIIIHIYNIYII